MTVRLTVLCPVRRNAAAPKTPKARNAHNVPSNACSARNTESAEPPNCFGCSLATGRWHDGRVTENQVSEVPSAAEEEVVASAAT